MTTRRVAPTHCLAANGDTLLRRSALHYLHRGELRLVGEIIDYTDVIPMRKGDEQHAPNGLGKLSSRGRMFLYLNHEEILCTHDYGLRVTSQGNRLRMECPIRPDRGIVNADAWPKLRNALRAGEVTGMSFHFRNAVETQLADRKLIVDCDLWEVSVITYPHKPALASWCNVFEPVSSLSQLKTQRKQPCTTY